MVELVTAAAVVGATAVSAHEGENQEGEEDQPKGFVLEQFTDATHIHKSFSVIYYGVSAAPKGALRRLSVIIL